LPLHERTCFASSAASGPVDNATFLLANASRRWILNQRDYTSSNATNRSTLQQRGCISYEHGVWVRLYTMIMGMYRYMPMIITFHPLPHCVVAELCCIAPLPAYHGHADAQGGGHNAEDEQACGRTGREHTSKRTYVRQTDIYPNF
jgi:hypothetical protein